MTPAAAARGWLAPLVLLWAAACSAVPSAPPGGRAAPDTGRWHEALRLVAQADELAERGEARAAFAAYERVLRDHPGDPAGAGALYGMARLQADPWGVLRSYPGAHRAFSRVLTEYPGSRWETEARLWRAVMADLIAREEEAARLKSQIERLRRTDLDLERRSTTRP